MVRSRMLESLEPRIFVIRSLAAQKMESDLSELT